MRQAVADKGKFDRLINVHAEAWTLLEATMADLLYQLANSKTDSRIAHAIYFSLDTFHTRQTIVHAAVTEWVYENRTDFDLGALWNRLHDKLNSARRMRNNIAHGAVRWFKASDDELYVRLLPHHYENRVVKATRDGKVPGETAHNVQVAADRLPVIA